MILGGTGFDLGGIAVILFDRNGDDGNVFVFVAESEVCPLIRG